MYSDFNSKTAPLSSAHWPLITGGYYDWWVAVMYGPVAAVRVSLQNSIWQHCDKDPSTCLPFSSWKHLLQTQLALWQWILDWERVWRFFNWITAWLIPFKQNCLGGFVWVVFCSFFVVQVAVFHVFTLQTLVLKTITTSTSSEKKSKTDRRKTKRLKQG